MRWWTASALYRFLPKASLMYIQSILIPSIPPWTGFTMSVYFSSWFTQREFSVAQLIVLGLVG